MAKPVIKLLDGAIATGAGSSSQLPSSVSAGQTSKMTFQAIGSVSASTGSVSAAVEVSNDNAHWLTLGTITLSLTTSNSTDGFAADAAWAYVRGNVTAISGTDAEVTLYMVV